MTEFSSPVEDQRRRAPVLFALLFAVCLFSVAGIAVFQLIGSSGDSANTATDNSTSSPNTSAPTGGDSNELVTGDPVTTTESDRVDPVNPVNPVGTAPATVINAAESASASAAGTIAVSFGSTTSTTIEALTTTTTEAATTTTESAPTTTTASTATTPPSTAAPAVDAKPQPWFTEGTTRVAYAVDSTLIVHREPDGQVGWALPNPTQFGGPRVVVVLEDSADGLWHKVTVPVQPNHTLGWVRAADVRVEEHNYRSRITLSTRRVEVWNGDDLVADTGAVVGKSSTPTPLGTFFVRDIIKQSYGGGAYGPYIVALSGFSEVLESFGGGLPAIAVHGTNRPDLIGSASSNGCIRIPNSIIELLAAQLPLGTPVEIQS